MCIRDRVETVRGKEKAKQVPLATCITEGLNHTKTHYSRHHIFNTELSGNIRKRPRLTKYLPTVAIQERAKIYKQNIHKNQERTKHVFTILQMSLVSKIFMALCFMK